MAGLSHSVQVNWTGGGTPLTSTKTVTDDEEINLDTTVALAGTDVLLPLAFDYTKLKEIYILASQNLTLEFNNSTTGVPTIALKANEAFHWIYGQGYFANPFTENVTALYATNSSGVEATLQIRALVSS